jgi:hypothetical protein
LLFLALSRDGAFSQSFRLSAGDAGMSTFAKGFVGGIMGTEPLQRFPHTSASTSPVTCKFDIDMADQYLTSA